MSDTKMLSRAIQRATGLDIRIQIPHFASSFLFWNGVAMYETFILPVLRFPPKIEAAITRGLDRADEKHQNRNK